LVVYTKKADTGLGDPGEGRGALVFQKKEKDAHAAGVGTLMVGVGKKVCYKRWHQRVGWARGFKKGRGRQNADDLGCAWEWSCLHRGRIPRKGKSIPQLTKKQFWGSTFL